MELSFTYMQDDYFVYARRVTKVIFHSLTFHLVTVSDINGLRKIDVWESWGMQGL